MGIVKSNMIEGRVLGRPLAIFGSLERTADSYTDSELRDIKAEAEAAALSLVDRGYALSHVNASIIGVSAYSREIAPNSYGDSLAAETYYHSAAQGKSWETSSGPDRCPAWAN
jgi:hypothetical protein